MTETKDRIKQVMSWANMTQNEFAVKLKISPASLSSIFSGRTRPTNLHIASIHAAFPQISVNWLMFGEGEMITASGIGFSCAENVEVAIEDLPAVSDAQDFELFSDEFRNPNEVAVGVSRRNETSISPSPQRSARGAQVASGQQPVVSEKALYERLKNDSSRFMNNTNYFDSQQRRITEIRVFYDNGTFESFFLSKK